MAAEWELSCSEAGGKEGIFRARTAEFGDLITSPLPPSSQEASPPLAVRGRGSDRKGAILSDCQQQEASGKIPAIISVCALTS